MKLIDLTDPLDADVPVYPGTTPLVLNRSSESREATATNVWTLHISAHSGTHVGVTESGAVDHGVPLRVVDAEGAPPRVVLRGN